ncbi:unnamed protein product, partial [Polarella glacialis]
MARTRNAHLALVLTVIDIVSLCAGSGVDSQKAEVTQWTHEYAARRAGYYLADARKMLAKAVQHWRNREKGQKGPDPYLKIWDAQSQLSAALSWDESNPELWLEAGNLTFTLGGLMREIDEGDLLGDALSFWARSLDLEEAAAAGGGSQERPLAARLRTWLEELNSSPSSKKLPQRLWKSVQKEAWVAVKGWSTGGRPPVVQRLPGRVAKEAARALAKLSLSCSGGSLDSCSAGASQEASSDSSEGAASDWVGSKVKAGRQVVFPTYISRFNLLEELGEKFFKTLSKVAESKYLEFREHRLQELRKNGVPPDQWETQINDNFFGFQETSSKSILQSAQARQRWPELYESK